jgi:hypothetical protein
VAEELEENHVYFGGYRNESQVALLTGNDTRLPFLLVTMIEPPCTRVGSSATLRVTGEVSSRCTARSNHQPSTNKQLRASAAASVSTNNNEHVMR